MLLGEIITFSEQTSIDSLFVSILHRNPDKFDFPKLLIKSFQLVIQVHTSG